jgi:APA family basic amino acid/polyamine antiporter
VAFGAAVSAFGALNGWILLQGQMPLAAARDGLFPGVFGKVSRRGTPVAGLVISSLLVTGLMALNFTASLVDQFTFIILLATLSTLIPYIFSSLAELAMVARERTAHEVSAAGGSGAGSKAEAETPPETDSFARGSWKARSGLALLALAYSVWASVGAGPRTLFWGLALLLAGLPVYGWQVWRGDGDPTVPGGTPPEPRHRGRDRRR